MNIMKSSLFRRVCAAVGLVCMGLICGIGGIQQGQLLTTVVGVMMLVAAVVLVRSGTPRDPYENEPAESLPFLAPRVVLVCVLVFGGIGLLALGDWLEAQGLVPWLVGTDRGGR